MGERLHKVLAAKGIASRRRAEELIALGRVTVNDVPARVGQQVERTDAIAVDGVAVTTDEPLIYLALHKPRGVISAAAGAHGDLSVTDLVAVPQRVFPVGRLDKDSSGLLFLTNDGGWSNLVTHPRYGIEKEYLVLAVGVPDDVDVQRLRTGVQLPDGAGTLPARVHRRGGLRDQSRFSVTVVEGKRRQIRLMFAAIGHPTIELKRVRIGPIELGSLAPGAWRHLSREEVDLVRDTAGRTASGGAPVRPPDRDRRTRIRR